MANWLSDLAVPGAMAVAAGLVGSFAVMRRMALASDALSHVALPGIGLALALQLNPVAGGLAALFLGTVLVWAVQYRTRISTETVIGVVFSLALALGSMIASGEELIEALFGGATGVPMVESVLGLLAATTIVVFVLSARHRLLISLVSADLARTARIDVPRLDLLYLLAFAVTVALGLRYLGVLLMGSLIIIPAATAKQVAKSLNAMLAVAAAVALLATLLGLYAAPRLGQDSGALIITFAAGFFFVSLLVRRRA
jgi:ABC-type Mn2+/Zn2+ transport system permease subunit